MTGGGAGGAVGGGVGAGGVCAEANAPSAMMEKLFMVWLGCALILWSFWNLDLIDGADRAGV